MEIAVLVEPIANNRFRAVSGEPLHLETEGPTRDHAIQEMRRLIETRMAAGAEVVAVSIGSSAHPLQAYAGMLKDDPLLESWKEAMADYRTNREMGSGMP